MPIIVIVRNSKYTTNHTSWPNWNLKHELHDRFCDCYINGLQLLFAVGIKAIMLSLCRYRIDHLAGVGYGGQPIVERGYRLASDNVVVTTVIRLQFHCDSTALRPFDDLTTKN